MSPEQALGLSRQVDERSDVFSLGVIFFEILAGRRPGYPATVATAGTPSVDVQKSDRAGRDSPRAINPAVPPALERICLRAMADRPDERYPTARAFADDLDEWLHRNEARQRGGAFRKALIAAASLALLAIAGVALGWPALGTGVWRNGLRGGPAEIGRLLGPAPEDDDGGATSPPAATADSPSPSPPPPDARQENAVIAAPADERLVGNLRKKRYHLPTCDDVKGMSDANVYRLKDRDEAVARGLKPCDHCHPESPPAAPDEG
jgi:hypothetical protein